MQELPYASAHIVMLQGSIPLALVITHSPDVKRAALACPVPTSLFGNFDGQILRVASQLL